MAVGQKWLDTGQEFAVDLLDLNTRSGVAATYFGTWGSNGATPAVTDATCVLTENAEARTSIPAGSMSQPATDTVRWTYTIVATGTRTVQETGVTTTSTGAGVPQVRIVHGSLALESGDQVAYTVNLQLKDVSE